MTPNEAAEFALTPIAYIRSCYTQRFGIPRQAGLAPSATAQIVLKDTQENQLSIKGLEDFSHLWVVFVFHSDRYKKSKPMVWPPRLGGKKKMGVFATRSPNRPNPIGLSAVTLESITRKKNEILIEIKGGDFLDGTPVLDIKPYIAFADSIPTATSTWVAPIEEVMTVEWTEVALNGLSDSMEPTADSAMLRQLIDETIALDPRPAHERDKDGLPNQRWHMRLFDLDISWGVINGVAEITEVKPYEHSAL